MTIYIIRERKKLQLYAVAPDQEVAFLAENKHKILAYGDSLCEAVSRLGRLTERLHILDELSKE